MTALTQDRNTKKRGGTDFSRPVAAGVKVLAGSLVAISATGFATPGAVATTLKADGRAEETVDNTAGADGDVSVKVHKGVFLFANEATDLITVADIGNDCYIFDDQSVAKTNGAATRSIAGKIMDVDASGVWVKF